MAMEIEFTGERVVPAKTPYSMMQEHIGRYVFASWFIKEGDVVLDIACGTGYGADYLSKKDSTRVYGGDIGRQVVEFAQHCYGNDKVNFITCDCLDLPFPNQFFDVVCSIETIEHLNAPNAFLNECKRVLKDDGIFICTTPNGLIFHFWGLGDKGYHVHEFSIKEIQELFPKYWNNIEIFGQCYVGFVTNMIRILIRILRDYIFMSASKLLQMSPVGEKIRHLLRPYFQERRPSFVRITAEMLDKKFEFIPFVGGKPKYLGIVARNT